MLPYTVVNPCTVVIVLLNAFVTDIAVVSSPGSSSAAFEAYSLNVFRIYGMFFQFSWRIQ